MIKELVTALCILRVGDEVIGRCQESRKCAEWEYFTVVPSELLTHFFIHFHQAILFILLDQRLLKRHGVGNLLVKNRPHFGLRSQMLLDFLQRAFTFFASLRWRSLVGDIEHSVRSLYRFLDFLQHQFLFSFDTWHIHQSEFMTIHLEVVTRGLASEVLSSLTNDAAVSRSFQFTKTAFSLLSLFNQRLFMLLGLGLLDDQ